MPVLWAMMLAVSSSGESSWISNIQPAGTDRSARPGGAVLELLLLFGVYEDIVPLRAASMEKGSAAAEPEDLPKAGGSTRLNGVPLPDDRFLESSPTRLCFGDPRLLLMLLVFKDAVKVFFLCPTGDKRPVRRGAGAEYGAGLLSSVASARKNWEGLTGVLSTPFDRFWGENGVVGARFSVSGSSAKRSCCRLTGDENVDFSFDVLSDVMEEMAIEIHCKHRCTLVNTLNHDF